MSDRQSSTWKTLANGFRTGSPVLKACILFQLVGPVGIALAFIGGVAHQRALLIGGIVLLGSAWSSRRLHGPLSELSATPGAAATVDA